MKPKLTLVVTPTRDPDGRRSCSNRGQLFDGAMDGEIVIRRSPQPLLDIARALLAAGIDPKTPIAMRHAGAETDALTATVGVAAGLTVQEGDYAPALRPWDADFLRRIRPPSDFSEGAATTLADRT
jgi:hypothetical protein